MGCRCVCKLCNEWMIAIGQNTLGSTFRIKFRFQLCDGQPDADLMLINNGCVESDALPSLQVMMVVIIIMIVMRM